MPVRQLSALWASQVLWSTILTLATTITGIVGLSLAPTPWLSTAPIALGALATALCTIPLGRGFAKHGRKRTLVFGSTLGVLATSGLMGGVILHSFLVFTIAYALFGCASAFALSYRFTATGLVAPSRFATVHAAFIAAGLVASLLGPYLATVSPPHAGLRMFALPYGIAAGLALLNFVVLATSGDLTAIDRAPSTGDSARPNAAVPSALAVLGGGVATGAMLLIMLATPLLMPLHAHAFTLSTVMEAHFVFMYLPGLFLALAVDRVGPAGMMGIGGAIGLAGIAVGATGSDTVDFLITMILIGGAWGIVTVCSATIISHHADTRLEVRYNFWIASIGALASLCVAPLALSVGWTLLNGLTGSSFVLLIVVTSKAALNLRMARDGSESG